MAIDINEYIKSRAAEIDRQIAAYISKTPEEEYIVKMFGKPDYKYDYAALGKSILDPTWYIMGMGGKRWRPVLMLLMMEALGKKAEEYAEFSIIPEIIHNSTLVHDDIEDNSLTRRNLPAVHVKHKLDVAVNLGDFLFFFPMIGLTNSKKITAGTKNKIFNSYIKHMTRVCLGQAVDIAWHNSLVDTGNITQAQYLEMTRDKTGVLASFACELGALLSGANKKTVKALSNFGSTVGVAFQIKDDMMNIYESKVSESKGGVGDDISEGKVTLMVIHALKEASKADRQRLVEILGMHTKERALIDEAIGIIDGTGAKQHAEQVQEEIVKKAWARVDAALPPSDAKEKLKAFSDFLISRTR